MTRGSPREEGLSLSSLEITQERVPTWYFKSHFRPVVSDWWGDIFVARQNSAHLTRGGLTLTRSPQRNVATESYRGSQCLRLDGLPAKDGEVRDAAETVPRERWYNFNTLHGEIKRYFSHRRQLATTSGDFVKLAD